MKKILRRRKGPCSQPTQYYDAVRRLPQDVYNSLLEKPNNHKPVVGEKCIGWPMKTQYGGLIAQYHYQVTQLLQCQRGDPKPLRDHKVHGQNFNGQPQYLPSSGSGVSKAPPAAAGRILQRPFITLSSKQRFNSCYKRLA